MSPGLHLVPQPIAGNTIHFPAGLSKNKAYLITVDGRAKGNSAGVSLWEFTKIMHYIGVNDAINVDGGGSTTLYVEGQNENGIVNHPSDNGKFDRKGERSVVNSILFIKK